MYVPSLHNSPRLCHTPKLQRNYVSRVVDCYQFYYLVSLLNWPNWKIVFSMKLAIIIRRKVFCREIRWIWFARWMYCQCVMSRTPRNLISISLAVACLVISTRMGILIMCPRVLHTAISRQLEENRLIRVSHRLWERIRWVIIGKQWKSVHY